MEQCIQAVLLMVKCLQAFGFPYVHVYVCPCTGRGLEGSYTPESTSLQGREGQSVTSSEPCCYRDGPHRSSTLSLLDSPPGAWRAPCPLCLTPLCALPVCTHLPEGVAGCSQPQGSRLHSQHLAWSVTLGKGPGAFLLGP